MRVRAAAARGVGSVGATAELLALRLRAWHRVWLRLSLSLQLLSSLSGSSSCSASAFPPLRQTGRASNGGGGGGGMSSFDSDLIF